MSNKTRKEIFEKDVPQYVFRLYITGASPNSVRAITNTKSICEEYLPANYKLEVIDVYRNPMLATDEDIVALPMLIKKSPLPEKRLVGDMSDVARVLKGIGWRNENQ